MRWICHPRNGRRRGTAEPRRPFRRIARQRPAARFVLKTDVTRHYASIDHVKLLGRLAAVVPDREVLNLVGQICGRRAWRALFRVSMRDSARLPSLAAPWGVLPGRAGHSARKDEALLRPLHGRRTGARADALEAAPCGSGDERDVRRVGSGETSRQDVHRTNGKGFRLSRVPAQPERHPAGTANKGAIRSTHGPVSRETAHRKEPSLCARVVRAAVGAGRARTVGNKLAVRGSSAVPT